MKYIASFALAVFWLLLDIRSFVLFLYMLAQKLNYNRVLHVNIIHDFIQIFPWKYGTQIYFIEWIRDG